MAGEEGGAGRCVPASGTVEGARKVMSILWSRWSWEIRRSREWSAIMVLLEEKREGELGVNCVLEGLRIQVNNRE